MQPLDPQWFVRTRSIYWHDRIPVMSQQNDHAVFFWGIGLMQQIVCPGTDTKAEPHSKFLRRYTQRFAFFSFAQCFIFIYLECASVKVCKLVIGRAMKVGRDIRPFPLSAGIPVSCEFTTSVGKQRSICPQNFFNLVSVVRWSIQNVPLLVAVRINREQTTVP